MSSVRSRVRASEVARLVAAAVVPFIGSVGAGGGGRHDEEDEAVGYSGISKPAVEAIADTGSPRSKRRAALNAPSADLGVEFVLPEVQNTEDHVWMLGRVRWFVCGVMCTSVDLVCCTN